MHDATPLSVAKIGDPVFVLCSARTGSTLLRFMLDAHPALACPPETNLPGMAVQLATVWSLIEGAPLAAERGDEPPAIPEAAIAGVRRTMDEMIGSYVTRRGKRRYCDKSLGTARYAELLLRIYPDAKFLCLYRHPMDVISSGLEACPWGLNGYGFERYAASTPGNMILAIARYWTDMVAAILSVEAQFPESCHRVRYEDLVDRPDDVANGIFDFLGEPRVPEVSARCFSTEREQFGPGDFKIWHTSEIKPTSVGRGWSIPAAIIPPPVTEAMNDLAQRLQYVEVDENWGTAAKPTDLRMASEHTYLHDDALSITTRSQFIDIEARLRAGLSRVNGDFSHTWQSCASEKFAIAVVSPVGDGAAGRWCVDLEARTVTDVTGTSDDSDGTSWDIVGSSDAWDSLLSGRTNLGVAMRRCELRYCESTELTEGAVAADIRLGMLANLLGLRSSWRVRELATSPSLP